MSPQWGHVHLWLHLSTGTWPAPQTETFMDPPVIINVTEDMSWWEFPVESVSSAETGKEIQLSVSVSPDPHLDLAGVFIDFYWLLLTPDCKSHQSKNT